MLKDIIKSRNLSVYRLAKETNLPYTTVNEIVLGKKNVENCSLATIMPILNYLDIDIDELISSKKKKIELASTWEEKKDKKFIFPIITKDTPYEAKYIHPLMQREVKKVYDTISKEKCVEKLILFGSSINIRCNYQSDLDFAVKLKDDCFTIENKNMISELIQEITEYNADVIWLNSLEKGTLLETNIKKGIVIYEQTTSKSKD